MALSCPLCRCQRTSFFCTSCVSGGDFALVRGTGGGLLVRFADMQLRLLTRQAEADEAALDCEQLLREEETFSGAAAVEQAVLDRRASVLAACFRVKAEALEKSRIDKEKIAKEIWGLRSRLRNAGVDEIARRQNLLRIRDRKAGSEAKLKSVLKLLWEERANKVRALLKLVFPITEKVESTPPCESAIESQLFEALNLTYYQGSWIDLGRTADAPEMQIVAPCLPANLDAAAFLALLSAGDTDKCTSTNCGLSFANQAVQILAHMTDSHLPCPLPLSAFLSANETLGVKCTALARLKRNIAVLCLQLGVPAKLIGVNEVLGNVRLLEVVMNEEDDPASREKVLERLADRLEIASPSEDAADVILFRRLADWSMLEQMSASTTDKRLY
ncbi:unnamed protein product [Notodromas monacha]|uniref:Uncharacterized protein n=1 Tax=Notodromas monacha TaxID=399045 RepID=A0A7R9BSU3_9CRUS|nr:unnamed protein product [Notodromas monacha]CAG0921098.1 unnamed protein product [Notodromas monacha]